MAFFPIRQVNQSIANNSVDFPFLLFAVIDDMVSLGWRVLGSGDGLSLFENQGQTAGGGADPGNPWGDFSVIRSGGAGANGLSNQTFNVGSSWIRLATPLDAAVYREYLWTLDWRSGISLADWRLEHSLSNPAFNSGADHDTAPVATNYISLAGNQVQQASSADFRTWIPSGGGTFNHWILGDKDDEYAFILFNIRTSDNGVWGVWGLDQIVPAFPGTNPPATEDPDPFYHLISHASSSGNSFDWAANSNVGRSDLSIDSDTRIEDFVGTQAPERGIIASVLLGEPGPPAEAGHYQFALGRHGEGDFTSSFPFIGVSPGLGRLYSVNAVPVLKAAVSPKFFKGFARGRLLRQVSNDQGIPNTIFDGSLPTAEQTRARFGQMGLSFPWPNGVGVSV